MATVPNRVRPGDLITSAYFNTIIDELADLERRLALLENSAPPGDPTGEGPVSISSFAPTADLRSGQELVIFGQNFGFSTGSHSVFFNSTRVLIVKTGSSNTKLIIEIPDVPGVTENGMQVTLTVANFSSTDTRQLTLKPRQITEQGNITLSFLDVTPSTIVTGGAGPGPAFRYQISAPILIPVAVTITPTISITSLQAGLQVLDGAGAPLPGNQITIQPGQSTQISVRSGVIPGGTTTLRMTVNASGAGLQGSIDARDFPVGTPIEPPDPSVPVLAFNSAAPPESFSGNIITRAAGATATVQLRAEFTGTTQRTYNVQVAVLGLATGWTAVRSASPFFSTPPSYTVSSPAVQFPAFDVTPAPGATTPATVEFTLQRVGSTQKKTVQFTLNRT